MTNVPLTMKTTPPTMTMRNPRLNMTSKRFSSRSPSPLFQLSMMAYVPTATRSPVFEKKPTIICLKFHLPFFSNLLHVNKEVKKALEKTNSIFHNNDGNSRLYNSKSLWGLFNFKWYWGKGSFWGWDSLSLMLPIFLRPSLSETLFSKVRKSLSRTVVSFWHVYY